MQLLIIGSNGQLGWELCRQAKEKSFDILPLDLPEFNITDKSAVLNAVFQSNADLVINAAAYTAVDKAESEPDIAYSINSNGPSYLATACVNAGIPLIHVSTDYVFDGKKQGAYCETDTCCPIGVYGKSKAKGEENIRSLLKEHIIIRTSWLCGVHGNNFVKTMLRLAREREEISVVNDQHGCPTFAFDLADAILTIAEKISRKTDIPWGTYHYCGAEGTTWYGFAKKIFEIAKEYEDLKLKTLNRITTAEYPTPAKRPENSIMDCMALKKNFGIETRPWEDSLKLMLCRLYSK